MKSKPKAKAKPKKTSHASNEVNNGHPEGSLEFCRKKLVLSLIQTLYHIYTFYVKFVAIRFLEAWPIGPIGLYFMWAWVVQCWKLSHLFTMLTIFDNFHNSDNCFCHFDNWKDNPGDLWHFRHWLQFWQLRTWIHDNLCYLTINCDTGQHSQFLRCLHNIFDIWHWYALTEGTDSTSTETYDISTILSHFHWWILRSSAIPKNIPSLSEQ